MTEILTESFCERCGTRFTFESSAPRKSRVGRVKVFSKGVRNFVLTDDSSFSEAMADARSAEELAATAHQLDAFHKTFNFCLSCRQYTCGSCWNNPEGRCLTCAPDPTLEAAAAVAEAVTATATIPVEDPAPAGASIPADAWPETDVAAERLSQVVGEPDAVDMAAATPVEAAGSGPGAPGTGGELDAEANAKAAAIAAGLAAGKRAEPDTTIDGVSDEPEAPHRPEVQGLVPGQSLEEAIAAWEASHVGGEGSVEPESQAVASAGVEQAVEPEPEPEPVAAAEPEPEPVAEPAKAPEPQPVPRGDDVVPQPTWPVAATPPEGPVPASPASPTAPAPWLTVAPDDGSPAPQWPTTPAWPTPGPHRDTPTTLAGRPLLPQGDASALWAASAREVLSAAPAAQPSAAAAPTPQPCVGCGLSLSANARFCRRCGTRQV